jgi:hypothetical protein
VKQIHRNASQSKQAAVHQRGIEVENDKVQAKVEQEDRPPGFPGGVIRFHVQKPSQSDDPGENSFLIQTLGGDKAEHHQNAGDTTEQWQQKQREIGTQDFPAISSQMKSVNKPFN